LHILELAVGVHQKGVPDAAFGGEGDEDSVLVGQRPAQELQVEIQCGVAFQELLSLRDDSLAF